MLAHRSLAPTGRRPGQSVSWFPSETMVGTWRETVSYWSKPTSHCVSNPLHATAWLCSNTGDAVSCLTLDIMALFWSKVPSHCMLMIQPGLWHTSEQDCSIAWVQMIHRNAVHEGFNQAECTLTKDAKSILKSYRQPAVAWCKSHLTFKHPNCTAF